MASQLIGVRVKALREERKLSQDDLARMLGFNNRQTVSAIETGTRQVTAEELVQMVERLGESLEYFTDPFRLVGEGRFSWRQTDVEAEHLAEYERKAGHWIAAFRALAPKVGHELPLMRQSLGLARHASFEDAMQAGERFAAEFDLGDVPALRLSNVMERELGILVLMVDAFQGISGASCVLPELDTVLIARGEVAGRRNFDLAHELFHILTWEAMPPNHSEPRQHSEEPGRVGSKRVEQLAENFASATLMPASVLAGFGDDWPNLSRKDLIVRLNKTASTLHVTASALKWRLVALGKLERATARSISDAALRKNGRVRSNDVRPVLFSQPFMEVIGLAVNEGRVSIRRAAALLDLDIEALKDLFAAHDVKCLVEL